MDTSTTAGGDEQQKCVADDEGSDDERAMATMAKKRVRAARVMVKREAATEETN